MEILHSYQNGNCHVQIFMDGTKTRTWSDGETPSPEWPESIDLKITNMCRGNSSGGASSHPPCRQWCHEQSVPGGEHADLRWILKTLDELPPGVEIAIGGGNPMDYPELNTLLRELRSRGLIANLTMNGHHLTGRVDDNVSVAQRQEAQYKAVSTAEQILAWQRRGMLWGIGISYQDHFANTLVLGLHSPPLGRLLEDDRTVLHVIAGVHDVTQIKKLSKELKLLVLGYKEFGFGKKYYQIGNVPRTLGPWKYFIGSLLRTHKVSFDNLALEQLAVKDLITPEAWASHYMGDDGKFTMYIDAVNETFAKSSTSTRIGTHERNIKELFAEVRSTS